MCASCVTPLGEDSGPGFLGTLPHAAFPLADFALYLFTVISHSHEDNYMMIPVSPQQIIEPGSGLGRPSIHHHMAQRVFLRSKLMQRKRLKRCRGRFLTEFLVTQIKL